MIKNNTQNKGITLIALVVTIIVLLILAGVTISLVLNQNGIFDKATEAGKQTDMAEVKEQISLDVLTWRTNHMGNSPDEATIKGIATKYGTLNGTILTTKKGNQVDISDILGQAGTGSSEEQIEGVTIPNGFYYVGGTKKDGIVISDIKGDDMANTKQGNQFVFVPVENIEDMAKKTNGTDKNGRENYQGKLYWFTSTTATEMTNYGQGTTSYREPDIVTDYDNNTSYNNGLFTKDSLQEEFNSMVESVKKEKGFYIGRYEMSLDTDKKAQVKKGSTSADVRGSDTNMWYGLYAKAKTYANSNNTNVKSTMLWGSQYDAMMRWMQGNSIDVTLTNPNKNTTRVTGSVETDQLNHIYDLFGNSFEWTMEAGSTGVRAYRGGYYGNDRLPSSRIIGNANYTNSGVGVRLALY